MAKDILFCTQIRPYPKTISLVKYPFATNKSEGVSENNDNVRSP